jgi:hypothetical protein
MHAGVKSFGEFQLQSGFTDKGWSRLCPFPSRGEGSTGKIPHLKPIQKMKLTRQEKEQIEKALSVYIEDRYELADNSENKEDHEFFRVEALEAQDLRERVQASIYQ